MIVNLSLDNIGENVVFSYMTPLRGLQKFTSIVEDLSGVDPPTKDFLKEFRFAMDGVKFGDNWYPLSLLNLQNEITPSGDMPLKNDLIIEIRYTRIGTDGSGSLLINSFVIDGLFSMEYLQVLDFEDTIFEDIAWTDEYFNKVWLNLINKLYKFGIVPSYITRADDAQFKDDDYIALLKTSSYFVALLISLMDKVVVHLTDDERLLGAFLRERGLLVSGDESTEVLNGFANTIYDQIRRRATAEIVRVDGDWNDNIVEDPRHGELLRYVSFRVIEDEFLFEYIRGGYYLEVNSPIYYGLTNHLQLNKAPENTKDFVDLSKFVIPIAGPVIQNDGGKEVCLLPKETTIETKEIKLNEFLSYEITFFFKVGLCSTHVDHGLTVKLRTYDSSGFQIDTLSMVDSSINGTIVENYAPATVDDYYFFRGIIYQSSPIQTSDLVPDVSSGQNLKMGVGVKRLIVSIENIGAALADSELRIWDLKCMPLSDPKPETFVNGIDYTRIWLKNRSLEFNNNVIKDTIKNQQIPFGSDLSINFLK